MVNGSRFMVNGLGNKKIGVLSDNVAENVYLCSVKRKNDTIMATYTITLNERTAKGKALMEYLQALGVLVKKVSPKAKSSYQRSQEDKLAGRVEKFSSSEEMFKSLGI